MEAFSIPILRDGKLCMSGTIEANGEQYQHLLICMDGVDGWGKFEGLDLWFDRETYLWKACEGVEEDELQQVIEEYLEEQNPTTYCYWCHREMKKDPLKLVAAGMWWDGCDEEGNLPNV